MSNYGQDRLYGAIDDDDDFMEEWRSSWEPASHTRVDEVMEQETVVPEDQGEHEDWQAPYEPEAAPAAADVAWGSWQAAPAMPEEPETITEVVAGMEAAPEPEAFGQPETSEPEMFAQPEASEPEASEAEASEPEASQPEAFAPQHTDEAEPAWHAVADEEPASQAEADEPETEAGQPETEAGEPDAERLVAPDDAQDLDLVDWEPEPTHVSEQAAMEEPAEESEEAGEETGPTEESDLIGHEPEASGEETPAAVETEEAEPDHSVGLTGAAAAALAAASAWGVWGGTPAVPSMPAPSPFPVAEPESEPQVAEAQEQEPYTEPQAEEAAAAEPERSEAVEPEPSGLYVPEPEVLSIPEPQPSSDEPEAASFSPGLVTTPIPEPDMYAAPGMPPFQVPEPEPYVIPEPPASSEPSPFARPTGDTTPIPEPGFAPEAPRPVDAAPIRGIDPTLAPHEEVHLAAGASAAYDLRVDVFSVLGFPPPTEPAPAADEAITPEAEGPVTVNDAAARFDGSDEPAETTDDVTYADEPTSTAAVDEAADVHPVDEEPTIHTDEVATDPDADPTQVEDASIESDQHPEHPRWFDRAKMWAANNLYDPDDESPASDAPPRDEQSH